jgi:hypothetical protein
MRLKSFKNFTGYTNTVNITCAGKCTAFHNKLLAKAKREFLRNDKTLSKATQKVKPTNNQLLNKVTREILNRNG